MSRVREMSLERNDHRKVATIAITNFYQDQSWRLQIRNPFWKTNIIYTKIIGIIASLQSPKTNTKANSCAFINAIFHRCVSAISGFNIF